MKRFFKYAAALVLFGAAISCQKSEFVSDEALATFEVNMPGALGTKAVGDGMTATELLYGVYAVTTATDATTNATTVTYTYIENGKGVANGDLKFKAEVRLVRNVAYRVVFWAQAPGNDAYTVDFANAEVVADYSAACSANDEARDAFYGYCDVTMTADATRSVELYRPLAQINFGSLNDDYQALSYFLKNGLKSTIAVSGLHDTFSLTEGTLSGSADVAFTADFAPVYNGEVFKGYESTHKLVGMNYVFAGEKQIMTYPMTATFTHDNDDIVIEVDNVPYQANYRTNILGYLFTEKLITNIEVKPIPVGDLFPEDK